MRCFWAAVLACLGALGCDEQALDAPQVRGSDLLGARTRAGARGRGGALVLAVVDGKQLTVADLAARIASLPSDEQARHRDIGARRSLLARMIDEKVMAQEALRRGIDEQPEVREALDQIVAGAMLERLAASQPTADAIELSVLRAFYERDGARYAVPERRRLAAVAFGTGAEAARARTRLGARPSEAAFDALVRASERDGAGDRGHVGPPDDASGDNGRVAVALRRAVFELASVGEVSGPVEDDGVSWLVRYSGHTAAQVRPFEAEEKNLRRELHRRTLEAAKKSHLATERARIGVNIDEAVLAEIEVPAGLDSNPYFDRFPERAPKRAPEPQ